MTEKILLVDDDVDTLRLVGLMLQRQGYQVIAANHALQALALIESERPDLALIDVMMPDVDGYELTRKIRHLSEEISGIPIIMFSVKSEVKDKLNGYQAGIDDYITKPTQPGELFARIKAILARGSKAPAARSTTPIQKGQVIGILSANSSHINSFLAANLGVALKTRTQREVIVSDYRPGEGWLASDLGLGKQEGFNRLLQKRPLEITAGDVAREMVSHSSGIRLLLSSSSPRDAQYASCVENFGVVTRHLSYQASYVVLDLGCALYPHVEKVVSACNSIFLILEPMLPAIRRGKLFVTELIAKGFLENQIVPVLIEQNSNHSQLTGSQVNGEFGIGIPFSLYLPESHPILGKVIPSILSQAGNATSQTLIKLADYVIGNANG